LKAWSCAFFSALSPFGLLKQKPLTGILVPSSTRDPFLRPPVHDWFLFFPGSFLTADGGLLVSTHPLLCLVAAYCSFRLFFELPVAFPPARFHEVIIFPFSSVFEFLCSRKKLFSLGNLFSPWTPFLRSRQLSPAPPGPPGSLVRVWGALPVRFLRTPLPFYELLRWRFVSFPPLQKSFFLLRTCIFF